MLETAQRSTVKIRQKMVFDSDFWCRERLVHYGGVY